MKTTNPYSWYWIKLPKIKICLEDSFKIITLLNTDIEINVIIGKLMENANLAIKWGSKLKLVFYISQNCSFLSFCKYIEIAIKGSRIKNPIFIIETDNYNLVLSQPFLNSTKFIKKYKPDKIFVTIIYLYTDQTAVFYTLVSQNQAN